MSTTTDEQTFNSAYWLHQPTQVRALQGNPDPGKAAELAQLGYTIDVPIMAWGWSAYYTMLNRLQFGFTWVPSALQPPVSVAPGLSMPGHVAYDPNNPPAGSIKVSLNLNDYPPVDPPQTAVNTATATAGVVGLPYGFDDLYILNPAKRDSVKDGQIISENGGTYQVNIKPSAVGVSAWVKRLS